MSEGHFEAKVERRSENKAGIFITFLVQPDDHDTALAQLRVGASVQIGWAEIVDTSVQKIEIESASRGGGSQPSSSGPAVCPRAAEDSGKSTKPRRRFSDLKPSAQAGMRCDEPAFKTFLGISYPALMREAGGDAAVVVRELCEVESRAELDAPSGEHAQYWRSLETAFQQWLLERNHAGLIR